MNIFDNSEKNIVAKNIFAKFDVSKTTKNFWGKNKHKDLKELYI